MVETIAPEQESVHSTEQSGARRPNQGTTHKETNTMTRRWYTIAVEYPHALEIFRHIMDHEESAKLWAYFNKLREQGSIGIFAIVKDDLASPLPDAAIQSTWSEAFIKQLNYLNPVLEPQ